MFPHEAQALMAKMMFIIFATIMLCMIKVKASTDGFTARNPHVLATSNTIY